MHVTLFSINDKDEDEGGKEKSGEEREALSGARTTLSSTQSKPPSTDCKSTLDYNFPFSIELQEDSSPVNLSNGSDAADP